MKFANPFKIWLPKKHQKSLDASWKEGIPGNIMLTLTEFYLTPYALLLGAPYAAIGMLVAWPSLLGSVFQLFAAERVRHAKSRLNFLIKMTRLQGFILIAAAGLCFWKGLLPVVLLTVLTVLFKIVGNWIASAWGSLMSDYLEPHERGRYMGGRQLITGLASMVALAIAGLFLDGIRSFSMELGFGLLFLFSGIARLISSHLFHGMEDIPFEEKPESRFTFWMFIRRFRQSNFVKFVLFSAGITFATQISAPYFGVYMLQDLHFNYFQYMSIYLVVVLAVLVSSPLWGRVADRVGNAHVLKFTGGLIPLIPLLWCVSTNWVYLLVVQVFGGFVWGGYNLCSANFILDSVQPEKRVRCLSYFNLINGIALFLGASLGGFLAENLPPLHGYSMISLFLVSGVLRLFFYALPINRFKEVRANVQKVSSRELFFSALGVQFSPSAQEQD
jgi:MFS family permease